MILLLGRDPDVEEEGLMVGYALAVDCPWVLKIRGMFRLIVFGYSLFELLQLRVVCIYPPPIIR